MEVEDKHEDVNIINFHCEGGDFYVQEEHETKKNFHMKDGHEDNEATIVVVEVEEEKEILGVANATIKDEK